MQVGKAWNGNQRFLYSDKASNACIVEIFFCPLTLILRHSRRLENRPEGRRRIETGGGSLLQLS